MLSSTVRIVAMSNKKRKNAIPLNIVQKRGSHKLVSKELLPVELTTNTKNTALTSESPSTGCSQVDSSDTNFADTGLDRSDNVSQSNQTGSQSQPENERLLRQNKKWKDCAPLVCKALVEEAGTKRCVQCINCGAPGVVRCHQCGPSIFFCFECGVHVHSIMNYHHFPEIWKVR